MNSYNSRTHDHDNQSVANRPSKRQNGKTSGFLVDNRPTSILQRKLNNGANSSQVIQMVRYVKTSTGKIKEVEDDYKLGWGEFEAEAPRVQAPPPIVTSAPPPPSSVPSRSITPPPSIRPMEQTPEERGYPLGFTSMKQFRDLTRPIAKANRDATIVVTGSSVTGRSGDGTRSFRNRGTRTIRGNKKSGPSDIDLGIVRPDSVGYGQVGYNGFPMRDTSLSYLERSYGQGVQSETGHPSGIKFFDEMPTEGRGRTPYRERRRIVRDHTPEGEREEEKTTMRRSSSSSYRGRGRGGRGWRKF